jgi:hypothetical protein
MEKKCPMDCDLETTPWCEHDEKDVFYVNENGNTYCYTIQEIFEILHTGFTALDTSYEVPPLRLQLPRDSYSRAIFSKKFIEQLINKIKITKDVPRYPEVSYFLKYYEKFYNNKQLKPFLQGGNDDQKVKLSKAIATFLNSKKDIKHVQNDIRMYWKFIKNINNIYQYIHKH